jgi:hypothetical protein
VDEKDHGRGGERQGEEEERILRADEAEGVEAEGKGIEPGVAADQMLLQQVEKEMNDRASGEETEGETALIFAEEEGDQPADQENADGAVEGLGGDEKGGPEEVERSGEEVGQDGTEIEEARHPGDAEPPFGEISPGDMCDEIRHGWISNLR